ncbi:phosphoribosyltransferase-like protein, partial [Escherichia coli]
LCPNLSATQRPLGHITLDTLGFGSLIVTFRNCPNNAPLALWVGEPWYPLFPRTTNSQTAIKRLFEDLTKGES